MAPSDRRSRSVSRHHIGASQAHRHGHLTLSRRDRNDPTRFNSPQQRWRRRRSQRALQIASPWCSVARVSAASPPPDSGCSARVDHCACDRYALKRRAIGVEGNETGADEHHSTPYILQPCPAAPLSRLRRAAPVAHAAGGFPPPRGPSRPSADERQDCCPEPYAIEAPRRSSESCRRSTDPHIRIPGQVSGEFCSPV
jgi:hypothetical protein